MADCCEMMRPPAAHHGIMFAADSSNLQAAPFNDTLDDDGASAESGL
jgi:hypothetical protein